MRQPVSLSQGQSMCPGVQLPVSNTCSSPPISEKHLRTVPLGSHSALGWNSSTLRSDPCFNPNWQIVNPKPGHGSPVTQQLPWFHDWYPSMLAAPSEWQFDPGAGAATLHHNQQPCFDTSCRRSSKRAISDYTALWDITLLQIPCTTFSSPSLSCIWGAGARRIRGQKCLLYIAHTGQRLFIRTR